MLLRDVLAYNKDEEILGALRGQNGALFADLNEADGRRSVLERRPGTLTSVTSS